MKDFYECEKDIVSMLSGKGVSLPKGCVQEVFEIISRILIDQGEVSLEAIGSFRKREGDVSNRVTFIPSRVIRRQLEESQFSAASSIQSGEVLLFSDETPATPAGHPLAETPSEDLNEPHAAHVSDAIPAADFQDEVPVEDFREELSSVTGKPESDAIWFDKSEKRKNTSKTRQLVLRITFVAVSLGLLAFILSSKMGNWYSLKKPSESEVVALPVVNTRQMNSASETFGEVSLTGKPEDQDRINDTEIVQKGDNLLDLSKKHYGHSCYWVYIFLENRDKLGTPFHLPEGAVLRIPRLEDSGIVPSDSTSRLAALNLAVELLEGKSGSRH